VFGGDRAGLRPARVRVSALAAVCVTVVLTGCSNDSSTTPDATTTSPTSTALQAADEIACSTAQTTARRLAAATADWSPRLHPFDAKFQATILKYANELEVTAEQATSDSVQTGMRSSAIAFADLSTAMARHDKAAFATALEETKTEYAKLKVICSF
jgi:hypothetical protein